MKIRVTQLTVVPDGKAIFDELATQVEIQDEGAGEFVVVKQTSSAQGEIKIDPAEWPIVREAIGRMVEEARA
jgi:hypothetical protein